MVDALKKLIGSKASLVLTFDEILHDNRSFIKKKDVEEAKMLVEHATRIVTGQKDFTKKLSSKDRIDYMNLVNSVIIDPNKKIFIRHMGNGMGIEEEFSGKKFYFQ